MKSLSKQSILIGIFILLLTNNLGFAQQSNVLYTGDPNNLVVDDPQNLAETSQKKEYSDEEARKMEQLFQRYQEQIINGWESKLIYTQARKIKNERDLNSNLEIFSQSDQKIQEYQNILQPLEQKIQSLKEELSFLDEQISMTQYKVSNVSQQIIEKKEQITRTIEDLDRSKIEVQNQEKILIDYVKLIYIHEQQYYDSQNKGINDVKLLLADQSISKTVSSGAYLQIVEKTGQTILSELQKVRTQLVDKETNLEEKQNRLQSLKGELEHQQSQLDQEQLAKHKLLETTQGDEARYQQLLQETEKQKEQSSQDILLLKDSLTSINTQLEALRKNTTNIDESVVQKKAESAAGLLNTTTLENNIKRFPWPVAPARGLSAYFNDANYIQVFGVGHGAIDIPTPQSTPIKAPADAYVYKAKDNGYGYSYIILAHRGGFLTLYGHVSNILVKEGDLIHKGDIIGLSGATPGTPGAGWRTTGPHLHFEVWKDGKKVDPLLYMDLTVLPMDKVNTSMLPATQEDVILVD